MLILVYFLGKSIEDFGTVYILKNKAMLGIYKIGLTRVGVDKRIQSLKSTSVPFVFVEVKSYKSETVLQLERYLHKKLNLSRVDSNKEFFYGFDDENIVNVVDKLVLSFSPKKRTKKEIDELLKIKDRAQGGASAMAKEYGLKNLAQMALMLDLTPQCLHNWHNLQPDRFRILLLGCVSKLQNEPD